MTVLNPAVGTKLEWRQPAAFERFHELVSEGEVTGTLRFEKRYGTLATAEYGPRQWTFKRSGFWAPKVTVRELGSTEDGAVFTPKWHGGGELAFGSGRRFTLKSVSFWGGQWTFETADGSEVISVHGPHGIIHSSGEVSMGLPAGSLPETPILLLLIWYLRLLMKDDAAATSG